MPCVAAVVSRPAWRMLVLLIARYVSNSKNEHYYYYYYYGVRTNCHSHDGQRHDEDGGHHVTHGERYEEVVEHVLQLAFVSDRQTDEHVASDGHDDDDEQQKDGPVGRRSDLLTFVRPAAAVGGFAVAYLGVRSAAASEVGAGAEALGRRRRPVEKPVGRFRHPGLPAGYQLHRRHAAPTTQLIVYPFLFHVAFNRCSPLTTRR